VMILLFVVFIGGSAWWLSNVVKDVAGDFTTALQLSMNMPTDRMEQEAAVMDATAVPGKLTSLLNQPVRVTGVLGDMAKLAPPGGGFTPPPQPAGAPPTQLFMEPGIFIMPGPGAVLPVGDSAGRTVEVVGILSRLTLGNAPGMTEEARKQLSERLSGSTDMPVIIARKVELVVSVK